ncbi:23S rRNA (pseudouridine(1915)-N(3))-methyltransferase RlmH [Candidatus Trichorickettsia mobilis]|uniref:23S rRNA (pseudouridine(1915)-N(3))-methyltransferase RlmH n=1 Tax=Candidatus Trichorickettsia mobilis TaxID=1346319 RepID=UPI00292E1687|nr:23S rRNA (pseudouridine(1915)-N(3))-methyltransferase RlmH [Candidatus Trichorickettsia mobilis]
MSKIINIISIGKLSENYQHIADDYQKMIKWQINSAEITYSQKLPATQIKQFEAKLITQRYRHKSSRIILDSNGKSLSSYDFAGLIDSQIMQGIDFIIGGAFGLDASILETIDNKISLSTMTFPHQLAKIILLEQIYRAQTILTNHPYHK